MKKQLKWEGLIIDYLTGDHFQFDTYKEAEIEYNKLLKKAKADNEEIDYQLLRVKKEFCNV